MTPQELTDLIKKYGLNQRRFAIALSKIPDCEFSYQTINKFCTGKEPITRRFRLAVDTFIRLHAPPS